ncbi:MAG: DUF1178 domain-containing protein [Alphaproteobacteria bacterium HGW-Alphaproteobacteria-6]|nr:MAG: DUF1178 domain-containing protein [Alphaproteobacteria bacterium HGW-Alphaproteobacteria-6]
MIRYALHCDKDHRFESWFQSAAAFDRLAGAAMIACAVCGSTRVDKTLMAPSLRPAREGAQDAQDPAPSLRGPATAQEAALAALRRRIEENADYVGLNFAAEARAIHAGETPGRSIWGEARIDEARDLIEDGIPVAPLPFVPARKTN